MHPHRFRPRTSGQARLGPAVKRTTAVRAGPTRGPFQDSGDEGVRRFRSSIRYRALLSSGRSAVAVAGFMQAPRRLGASRQRR